MNYEQSDNVSKDTEQGQLRQAVVGGSSAVLSSGIEQATKAYTMPVFLKLCKALGGWEFVFPAKGSEAALTRGATGSDDARG